MKLTKESLKWPQIDAAFRYIYDNPQKYHYRNRKLLPITDVYEFGCRYGHSLQKITNYIKENDFTGIPPYIHAFDSYEGLPKEDSNVEKFSKFAEGSYNTIDFGPDNLKRQISYELLSVYKCWFNQLNKKHAGKPALLIHIDCDLYVSTLDALKFLNDNDLIQYNTLIAYDEFESTVELGGEKRAHQEFFSSFYNCHTDEIWHNIYYDKDTGQRIRQSVFEVLI